uniref:serine hydrolase-like protein 2 n=1 Tax=Myxine glutinosa TaxID=7769 RepID=UPI00358EF5B0
MASGSVGRTMIGIAREMLLPVPGGHLAGKMWGPQDGPPVLCLHGWSDNSASFDTIIPHLPPEFHYVALDLPGHGHSSHRPPGVMMHFSDYLLDIQRLVSALKFEKFSILGHSMGGNIGGLFSSTFPEKVDKLVLLDSLGFFPKSEEQQLSTLRSAVTDFFSYEQQIAKAPKVYSKDGALQRLLTANQQLTEESAKLLLERGARKTPEGYVFNRDFRINLRFSERMDLTHCLKLQKKLCSSILIVLASNSSFQEEWNLLPLKELLVAYRCMKNVQVQFVQGNHHVHLNDPQAVAGLVGDFLRKETAKL